jgi:hypothetical protein
MRVEGGIFSKHTLGLIPYWRPTTICEILKAIQSDEIWTVHGSGFLSETRILWRHCEWNNLGSISVLTLITCENMPPRSVGQIEQHPPILHEGNLHSKSHKTRRRTTLNYVWFGYQRNSGLNNPLFWRLRPYCCVRRLAQKLKNRSECAIDWYERDPQK